MNRIILIGNGFDLAHGLPTRYEDFIKWYWERRLKGFEKNYTYRDQDVLCTFDVNPNIGDRLRWNEVFDFAMGRGLSSIEFIDRHILQNTAMFQVYYSMFFKNICRSIETKGWVDIEHEYYHFLKGISKKLLKYTLQELNAQMSYIQSLLIEYLGMLDTKLLIIQDLKSIIYGSIKAQDVSVSGQKELADYFKLWLRQDKKTLLYKLMRFDIPKIVYYVDDLYASRSVYQARFSDTESVLAALKDYDKKYDGLGLRPDRILFLNFNYTANAERYFSKEKGFEFNYIHGELRKAGSIIFGYGDELDKDYYEILNLNDNEYLRNMKSNRYLESSNYRDMLSFIESAPYQVYIMGHSCGNSDRTLLNTLFEHRNCVTIKPFYHQKADGTDDYLNIVQNISRNFTDMKLMRDRVVNKTYCEPLPQSL